MRKKAAVIVLIVVILCGSTGAYFAFHSLSSPHLGVVSQQNVSNVLNVSVRTLSNITNSNYPSYLNLPKNLTSVYGKLYYITNAHSYETLLLISFHFSSHSQADKFYANISGNFFVPSGVFINDTFRGFDFTWYGDISSNLVPYQAVGIDGSYSFLMTSLTLLSSNKTNVENLIHYQIDSML